MFHKAKIVVLLCGQSYSGKEKERATEASFMNTEAPVTAIKRKLREKTEDIRGFCWSKTTSSRRHRKNLGACKG